MLIFHKEKLVYFALPRTGTTSVQRVLAPASDIVFRNPPTLKHIRPARFRRKLHAQFFEDASAEYIAVMREPIDWLFSWFRYRQRPFLEGHPNSTKGIGFDAFVQSWLSDAPLPCANVGSQLRFVTDRSGELAVTHLFDFAHLEQFSAFLSERLQRPITFDRLNAAPEDTGHDLSPETERRCRQAHPRLFALYDSVRSEAERRTVSSRS